MKYVVTCNVHYSKKIFPRDWINKKNHKKFQTNKDKSLQIYWNGDKQFYYEMFGSLDIFSKWKATFWD